MPVFMLRKIKFKVFPSFKMMVISKYKRVLDFRSSSIPYTILWKCTHWFLDSYFR